MKNIIAVIMAAVFVLSLAVEMRADEPGATETSTRKAGKPSVMGEQAVEATATVEAVDMKKRLVTVRGPEGNVFDIKVGPEVKNLSEVKTGDQIKMTYYESVVVDVRKPGEAPPKREMTRMEERAEPGEKPAGMIGEQVTITATVAAIDPKKQEVTLKGPEGKTVEMNIQDPKNLENVQVGDEVVIAYTEALAVSIEKTKK